MPQPIHHHTFANGLTLLAERMEHVRSATLNVLVPSGCVYDPPDRLGIASVIYGIAAASVLSLTGRHVCDQPVSPAPEPEIEPVC